MLREADAHRGTLVQLLSQLLLPRLQRLQDQRQGGQAPHGLVQAPRPCKAAEAPRQPLQIITKALGIIYCRRLQLHLEGATGGP